ncbi:hypothetical protein GLYMA_05G112900v4 [Glycine max]|uniref:Uncharacterized protein n=2 Tax=Glycine subgen. Soja TaxID=1462606 RepID=A0A0R0JZ83_SOYBN|nr:hypothetical protein GYH30_012325 [Glycine max]KRH58217.1 hypothetical protein GLYMA_05G112900v4 [Glycine max]RZC12002.1 hypothetical protein D0Y65_011988 [Glycine soja]
MAYCIPNSPLLQGWKDKPMKELKCCCRATIDGLSATNFHECCDFKGPYGLLIGPPLAPVMGGFAGPDTNSGIGDLRQAKSRSGLTTLREVEVFCSPQIASLY